ncbi:hypothetical protein [Ligilactobacillus salivarius]|uniref:hypothetical protein n=1 Tax=Ligilactobacillus salivarius TaxID=1624 RepID=UPI0020238233|nr:hypothetical protein [Ligilactobacillus salivarius]URI13431.1 hypothetical protein M9Y03_03320 [Ligilactobacillus salivarius]UUB35268.1 hypothetical protein NO469_03320 [Ligilactobacillus salivarius]
MVVPLKSATDATVTPLSAVDEEIPISYNKDGNSFDGGGENMNKKFVTHDELKISQLETQNKLIQLDNKIDTKFSELNSKIDSKFNILDNKIDNLEKNIPIIIENALYKEREYQQNQQKENRRFFWGTIIIGGISAVAAIISAIVSFH